MYIQAIDVLLTRIETDIEQLPIIVTGLEEYFPVFSTRTVTGEQVNEATFLFPMR